MAITTSFRRLTDPLQIAVGPTPQRTDVPGGFIPDGVESFWVANPNAFWVRLKGSGMNRVSGAPMSGDYVEIIGDVGLGTGWLWPPGFVGVFATQKPRYVSAVSVACQGLTAGSGFIEIAWGLGV